MNNALLALKNAEEEIKSLRVPDKELAEGLVRAAQAQVSYLLAQNDARGAVDVIDRLGNIHHYLRQKVQQQQAEHITQNTVGLGRIHTIWDFDQWLEKYRTHKTGRPRKNGGDDATILQEIIDITGKSERELRRWLKINKFEDWQDIDTWAQEYMETGDITLTFLLRVLLNLHVSDDSYEWYTPTEYIEAARGLMGSIDLDPASSKEAQIIVKAGCFYTTEDDGLSQPWFGNVWLNPPYSMPAIEQFVDLAIHEYENGNVTAAVVLTNNSTDTGWFHRIVKYPVCFTRGRIQYWTPDRPHLATRQGQALFYLGDKVDLFAQLFGNFGVVLVHYDYQ